jgi:SPP1 gp7 family putative phage head morphogenesis protein
MLRTVHDELGKAIEEGTDLREFSRRLSERFDSAGWTQLNPSHVETVFRTGVMGAYNDGRKAQMSTPVMLKMRPYWQWLGVDDARTRPTHKAAIGKVLPATDPFFDRAGPPAGFNCRCRLVSRSARDLERLGLVPTIGAQLRGLPDEGWDAGGSLL